MIYVTHDQVEAMTLADRICVLRDGRVEQIGTPLELYEKPNSLFVAGFIGSPKMNFLTGSYSEPFGAHTVGLRPEHLAIVAEGGPWTGREEPLGVRESGVAARRSGETLSVSPMGDNIHRFDEKGRAV